jgi:hypothetical protein
MRPRENMGRMVISECSLPRGSDDLVDTVTQAIRWLREQGFVLKNVMCREEDLMYRGTAIAPFTE